MKSKTCSLHRPSGWKWGKKKRAELLSVCSRILEKSKCRESIAPQTQNGPRWIAKKTSDFILKNCQTMYAFIFRKTHKNVLMLVFFGPFTRFFHFFNFRKIQKNPKNVRKIVFFPVFPYALHHVLQIICIMQKANIFVNNLKK